MARLKVLSALDTARTQLYHFKAIIIAGMGLFTDAYDLFSITLIMKMLGPIYYAQDHSRTPPAVVSTMVTISLLGTTIGQLLFGRLGDRIGRRRVYGLALMLMVLSSFASGFSICTTRRTCVFLSLAFFRFFLGIGIGGDYPLSATIMSEFANKRTRGAFIAAVFSMQGFGILASSIVTMVICSIFDRATAPPFTPTTSTISTPPPPEADVAWRLVLMLGAIPAAMTYYWRMMMPETARYTALVEQNVMQAAKDMEKVLSLSISQIAEENPLPPTTAAGYPLLSREFFCRHGRDLFACSSAWFLVDVVFYSNNLFQFLIYKDYLKEAGKLNVYETAIEVARIQAIFAATSTIPGYFFTMYFIDRAGRRKIQMMGFFFMAIVYFVMGISYGEHWSKNTKAGGGTWFMFLQGLVFFFANFGPNTTTFIVPAELFPARFRSTCHGISGAVGKIGAIIGTVGFLWASHAEAEDGYPKGIGMTATLLILGGACILGMVVTFFFTTETMARSLEENEIELPPNHHTFELPNSL